LFAGIPLALLAAVLLAGCGQEEQSRPAAPESVTDLRVATVQQTSLPDLFEAIGTVRAAQTSQVASQLLANIREIRVSEGTRVRRGDTLAVLDDAQPQAAMERQQATLGAAEQELEAAQADATLAAATLKRYQDLYEKKSVSPQEFDEVTARQRAAAARRQMAAAGLEQAQAGLRQAQTVLGYTRIRAPFDGLITEKLVEPGDLATPGMPVLTLESTGRFRLEATVDERDIGFVHRQQNVPVAIEALGKSPLAGRVVQIVPVADPASRSFLVKVELPADARLRSGIFGRARFSRGERSGLLVPATAVVERGQLQGVYVAGPDNVLSLRYVTLGLPVDDQVEILSGLDGNETLVVDPGQRDLAGKRLESPQR
jgi:RND family efflux transporter MFP subunit